MIRTQISFESRLYEAARRAAKREGISLAEFCRRAIASALAERQPGGEWMALAGTLASGDPRASRSVDEIVYGRERP